MIPALMAARPLIKYGILIGVPVALFLAWSTYLYFKGYGSGKETAEAECQATLATQLNEMARQVVEAKQMESQVVREHAEQARLIQQQADALRKKVADDAKHSGSIPLSRRTLDRYDELRRMSNAAAPRVSPADLGAGTSEVSPGEVRTPPAQLVQVDTDTGESLELTTEELKQAVIGGYEKLAGCKNDYASLSMWNDRREQLEIGRMQHE